MGLSLPVSQRVKQRDKTRLLGKLFFLTEKKKKQKKQAQLA